MTRKEFQLLVFDVIKSIPAVKDVFENYIPPPSKVKKYPSVAVDFPVTTYKRLSGNTFTIDDTLHLYIYTKSRHSNKYIDSISDLVELISKEITTNTTLNSKVTDIYVTSVKTDGGVTYPEVVNRLEITSTYVTECG
jgi:hypothetical protein